MNKIIRKLIIEEAYSCPKGQKFDLSDLIQNFLLSEDGEEFRNGVITIPKNVDTDVDKQIIIIGNSLLYKEKEEEKRLEFPDILSGFEGLCALYKERTGEELKMFVLKNDKRKKQNLSKVGWIKNTTDIKKGVFTFEVILSDGDPEKEYKIKFLLKKLGFTPTEDEMVKKDDNTYGVVIKQSSPLRAEDEEDWRKKGSSIYYYLVEVKILPNQKTRVEYNPQENRIEVRIAKTIGQLWVSIPDLLEEEGFWIEKTNEVKSYQVTFKNGDIPSGITPVGYTCPNAFKTINGKRVNLGPQGPKYHLILTIF